MDREAVIKNLRACLLSAKGGVKIDNLIRDYRMLMDENIPFHKLGYTSLIAFLHSIPGIKTVDRGGDCYVEAIPTEESMHLTKLIGQQKSPSKKARKKVINTRRPNSFREPRTVKKNARAIKGGNNNYHSQPTNRTQSIVKENRENSKAFKFPSSSTYSPQPEVLSPLSPAQLLAGDNVVCLQHRLIDTPVPGDNIKRVMPNSPPAPITRITADSRKELITQANALNFLEPLYTILPTKMKNLKERFVYAKVKVGPHEYTSYPQEARTEDEAQKLAASIALLDLKEKYGSPYGITETTNMNLIKERVLEIVGNHPNGVFMHQVPIYYKQQYKEALPGNWQVAIQDCPSLTSEQGVDNSVILRRTATVRLQPYETISPKAGTVQLRPIGPIVPSELQFPEEDIWIVSVMYVISTIEVWVRFFGENYSEQFDIMTEEMKHQYSNPQHAVKPSEIEIGKYYAVFEDDSWHRVRCIDYNSTTGMVTVSFIDHGDEDCLQDHKLYVLDKKFCLLAPQAFRLCLSGLEDFSDCDSILPKIEEVLLGHAFYVEVIMRHVNRDGPVATVVFYNTEGPEDINLNVALSKQILQHIVTTPKLGVEGQVSEIFVSNVGKNAEIYIRVQSESMKHLIKLLDRLIKSKLSKEELEFCGITTVDSTKVYLASIEGNWYRVKVLKEISNTRSEVVLIDFGQTTTVANGNLLALEKLSELLASYPPQALKVRLHNIDKPMFNEKMVAKLAELAPTGEPLLAKVVKISKNEIPVVELLKRIQPSNMLVSINNTLVYEESTRLHGDGNNNIKPRKRGDRLNSKTSINEEDNYFRTLKPPRISRIGEYFDIHVTMAANPEHFIVQPFSDKRALQAMMVQLQEACLAYKGPPPAPESVKEGKLYAAEHIDGRWYRVCVSGTFPENTVGVYFCDFGDRSVLPLSKLQPLKTQFYELPYQAIKAKLAGIRAINVDWTVQDCLRFQDLVVEKSFVSIVVESIPDGHSPADKILGLKLINVDTHKDIYIDQLLVDEGRAKLIDS